jgi:hypothetical protein
MSAPKKVYDPIDDDMLVEMLGVRFSPDESDAFLLVCREQGMNNLDISWELLARM